MTARHEIHTPAEIAAACLLIQSGWTPDERLKRLRSDWRPMFRTADGRRLDIAAGDYQEHHERRAELQEAG